MNRDKLLSLVNFLAMAGPWVLLYTLIAYGELKTATFIVWMVFVAIAQGAILLGRRDAA